jgi:hypothetical protein
MYSTPLEGKLLDQQLNDGAHKAVADVLRAHHHLPLGDDIDRVDVVDPLDTVVIALVHAVYADVTGMALRVTSITAPVATGWSLGQVGLTPTGKRRLCTAHANSRHS